MVYISGGNELIDAAKVFDRLGLKSGMQVADLGCGGAGHFVIPAARLVGSMGLAYAVDILKSALQSVASKDRLEGINNVKTVWSNLEVAGATNISAASLDMDFLINILFQSQNHQAIIQEATRLLKPKGSLLVIDWNKTPTPFGPPAVDRVAVEEIKTLAQKAGLKLTDEFAAGTYHFGLIFQK